MQSRIEYYRQLVTQLQQQCLAIVPNHPGHTEESNQQLLDDLQAVLADFGHGPDYIELAGQILQRIISHYPDITPVMHRDLLWFCGGQCLHYLGDEEMDRYQLLEDRYFEKAAAEPNTRYRDLRAQIFGLH